MTLEDEAHLLMAGALEALGLAAFVCDADGQVRALTPGGATLVAQRRLLSLWHGRLRALSVCDETRLARAMAAAAGGALAPATQDLTIHSPSGKDRLHLQVAPLPKRRRASRLRAAILVVARTPRPVAERRPQLQAQFGLTPAEAEIALALAAGDTVAEIALARGVTVSTLRSHLKAIFGKVGVRRQAELCARLGPP